jgi:MFS transporter, UMF1 family
LDTFGIRSRRSARIVAWCLYDFAYSAFSTVVVTFVFATYFVRAVAGSVADGTAHWAITQGLAGFAVAVVAAPLGAVADRSGYRRGMLVGLTAVMVACTAGLWFVHPHPADVIPALVLVGAGTIAFELALVFYNAMLPDIAPAGQIGRVSGLAWGSGYVGGLICLGLCLTLLVGAQPAPLGLSSLEAGPVRATALFAAAWIALFSWPIIVWGPASTRRSYPATLRDGMAGLSYTLLSAARRPALLRFLIARMLYTDGLTTLFAFGAIFAAGTFGFDANHTLMLGIALNVTAGLGALGFAAVQDRIGDKAVILIALGALAGLGLSVLLARSVATFWALALPLGLFVGPAQSASRSLMARLAPADECNAFFGLYALSGRVTGFLGPMALGLITAATASQRAGMAVIVVLLTAGGLILAATEVAPTTG